MLPAAYLAAARLRNFSCIANILTRNDMWSTKIRHRAPPTHPPAPGDHEYFQPGTILDCGGYDPGKAASFTVRVVGVSKILNYDGGGV